MLAYLTDVSAAPLGGEAHGFTLSFRFAANPFFSNEVLTKTYQWADEDEDMLELAKGTDIAWAAGKDTTVKVMKKKPKKGGKPLTKLEPCESFFRFFSPPALPEDADELSEEEAEALQDAVESDYEMGATIREEIIPQAVAWFTGAAIEAGEDEEDEEDEEGDEARWVACVVCVGWGRGCCARVHVHALTRAVACFRVQDDDDEDDEDDDDDDEEEEGPRKAKGGAAKGGKGKGGGGKGAPAGAAGDNPECKQQ